MIVGSRYGRLSDGRPRARGGWETRGSERHSETPDTRHQRADTYARTFAATPSIVLYYLLKDFETPSAEPDHLPTTHTQSAEVFQSARPAPRGAGRAGGAHYSKQKKSFTLTSPPRVLVISVLLQTIREHEIPFV